MQLCGRVLWVQSLASKRNNAAPRLGSMVELTLVAGGMGELAPSLLCCEVAWVGERCLLPFASHQVGQVGELALR